MKNQELMPQSRLSLLACALSLFLWGCGGGGGGGGTVAPPVITPPGGSNWVSGVFLAASGFKNKCELVRTGQDIEGNRYLDTQGTLLDEKNWLRSWTNETYLWNTEVVDQDPSRFGSRTDYFAVLKTNALTSSGKSKDDFHFSQSTESYLLSRNSVPRAGYGARFVSFSNTIPRDFRVQYTEPNSPAAEIVSGVANFKRGTKILSIDGVDLVNGGTTQAELDILNNGLYPLTANEVHSFVVRDPGASVNRTVSIRSANLSTKPVNRTSVISTPTGSVGYILFNTFSPFSSEREISEAITLMKNGGVSDLVLDLRYNGGGLLAVASQLSYMVAGNGRTAGRTFEQLRFNAAAGSRNPVTGQANNPVPFYAQALGFSVTEGVALPSLNLPRVYVLTTSGTCSASEAVINGLRGIGVEVVLIGGKTCGKPFGFYPQDNCGETYYTIQFQGVNDVGFGDYADGFIPNNSPEAFGVRVPGCVANDDYDRELGDPSEALLSTALQYRSTGSCAVSVSSVLRGEGEAQKSLRSDAFSLTIPSEGLMDVNRDMSFIR